jgi:arabinosaccharide transport system substrate-binding protein
MKQDNKFTDYFGKDIFNIVINMKDKFHTSNITASPKFSLANSLVAGDILFKVLSEKSETPEQALKSAADEIKNSK